MQIDQQDIFDKYDIELINLSQHNFISKYVFRHNRDIRFDMFVSHIYAHDALIPMNPMGRQQQPSKQTYPDSKVYGANMEPNWGRQDPGRRHVGPMNLDTWVWRHGFNCIGVMPETYYMCTPLKGGRLFSRNGRSLWTADA